MNSIPPADIDLLRDYLNAQMRLEEMKRLVGVLQGKVNERFAKSAKQTTRFVLDNEIVTLGLDRGEVKVHSCKLDGVYKTQPKKLDLFKIMTAGDVLPNDPENIGD